MNFAISTKIDDNKYLRTHKLLGLVEKRRYGWYWPVSARWSGWPQSQYHKLAPLSSINSMIYDLYINCADERPTIFYWKSIRKICINLIRTSLKVKELTSCWFQSSVYYLYLTLKANRICYHRWTSISPLSKNKHHIEHHGTKKNK